MERKSKSNTRGNWNHPKDIHIVHEQHRGKERNPGNTENSHIVHCAPTAGSANVNVQNVYHGK